MRSILLTLFFLVGLAGCGLETKTLKDFYGKDLKQVSEIKVVDGNTGDSYSTIDQEKIDKFINEVKDVKFIPDKDQSKKDGFKYSVTLYENGNETFQFGLNYVDDVYYHTDPDIYPIVDKFYQLIKSEKDK